MMPACLAVRGLGCGLFLLASGVSAQVMLSPVAVTESGLGTFSQENGLIEMVNQSGLRTPFVNGTTSFETYFSPNNKSSQNANGTKWESLAAGLPLVGNLDFDLGASHQISKLAIWNISVKDITVHVAATQAGLATAPSAGSFTLTKHLSSAVPAPDMLADVLNLPAVQTGRFVRIRILSEHTLSPGDEFGSASIGEVVMAVGSSSQPTLAVTREPNGDVRVNFTGTLRSTENVEAGFQNVSGNPQETYLIPKANLGERRFFRSVAD
jgi:hypothetical protein